MASSEGGMEIEEVAAKHAGEDPQGVRRPGRRAGGLPGAQPGLRPGAARRRREERRRGDPAGLRRVHRDRRVAARGQPAGRAEGRTRAGARRQDDVRRQRALPPDRPRAAARLRRGRSCRDRGQALRPVVHQAGRQHRLHGQRRRAWRWRRWTPSSTSAASPRTSSTSAAAPPRSASRPRSRSSPPIRR